MSSSSCAVAETSTLVAYVGTSSVVSAIVAWLLVSACACLRLASLEAVCTPRDRSFKFPTRRNSSNDEDEDLEDAVSGSFVVPVSPTARTKKTDEDRRKPSFTFAIASSRRKKMKGDDKKKFSMTTLSTEAAHQVGF